MNRGKFRNLVVIAIGLGGSLAMAFSTAWTSGCDGLTHQNDQTCSTSSCLRCCRVCCAHFNPDVTSTAYSTCVSGCSGLPVLCPANPGGG